MGETAIKKKAFTINKIFIFFLFFIILSHVFTPCISAKDTESPYQEKKELPDGLIPYSPFPKDQEMNDFFQYLLQNPSDVVSYALKNPFIAAGYYTASFKQTFSSQAVGFGTDTPVVEIGYNESVSFGIGKLNYEIYKTTNFDNISLQPFMVSKSFTFIVDQFPGGKNESWQIDFTPDMLIIDEDNKNARYEINVTLSLTSPPIKDKAIQSGILRIKQAPAQAYGSFWDMPGTLGLLYTILFGRTSGVTNQPNYENMQYIDILVKVKPYHKVSIETPEVVTLNPNQVTALPLSIENLGNYKDTIGFKVASENTGITLIDPVDTTLRSGDTKDTILGIAANPDIIDFGTLHKVKIQAYSLDEPDEIISEKLIILKTEGVYLSPYTFGLIIILILIVGFLGFYFKYLRKTPVYTKSKKPEKKPKPVKEKIKKKKIKEIEKEKPKEKPEKKQERQDKVKIVQKKSVRKKPSIAQIKKNKAVKKIQREQEKQRKKSGGKI